MKKPSKEGISVNKDQMLDLINLCEQNTYNSHKEFNSVLASKKNKDKDVWLRSVNDWINSNITISKFDDKNNSIKIGLFNSFEFEYPTYKRKPAKFWFSTRWFSDALKFAQTGSFSKKVKGEVVTSKDYRMNRAKLDLLCIVAGKNGWDGYLNNVPFIWNKDNRKNQENKSQKETPIKEKLNSSGDTQSKRNTPGRQLIKIEWPISITVAVAFVILSWNFIKVQNKYEIVADNTSKAISVANRDLKLHNENTTSVWMLDSFPKPELLRLHINLFFDDLTDSFEQQRLFEQEKFVFLCIGCNLESWRKKREHWSESKIYLNYLSQCDIRKDVDSELLKEFGINKYSPKCMWGKYEIDLRNPPKVSSSFTNDLIKKSHMEQNDTIEMISNNLQNSLNRLNRSLNEGYNQFANFPEKDSMGLYLKRQTMQISIDYLDSLN